jgi:hypothetical protein
MQRLHSGDKPTSVYDSAALIHDIEYFNPELTNSGADNNMWSNIVRANPLLIPHANVVLAALSARSLLTTSQSNKYLYLLAKKLAIEKGLLHPRMSFSS